MKGKLKKLMLAFTASGILINTVASVSAAELAGGNVSTFDVKFSVIDTSGKYEGNSIKITMEDVTGTSKQKFKLSRGESWGNMDGNIPVISVPAPTTYNIKVTGLEDGYKLKDYMSGGDIDTSFAATSNGETTFYWEIVEDDGEVSANFAAESGKPKEEKKHKKGKEADNTGGAQVFSKFCDASAVMKTDPTWTDFFLMYSAPINIDTFAKMYADTVANGEKTETEKIEEFKNMSDYDRFLWIATYCYMADSVVNGYPEQISSYDALIENSACPISSMEIGDSKNAAEIVEVYKELLQWQADYISKNGSPYNFINEKSYLEEMGVDEVKESIKKDDEKLDKDGLTAKDKKEINEVRNEYKAEEQKKKPGIWDDTMDILSDNLITILIMAILAAVLAYVIHLKKQNNYTDDVKEK